MGVIPNPATVLSWWVRPVPNNERELLASDFKGLKARFLTCLWHVRNDNGCVSFSCYPSNDEGKREDEYPTRNPYSLSVLPIMNVPAVTFRIPWHISQHSRCRNALSDDLRDYEFDPGQTSGSSLQLISKIFQAFLTLIIAGSRDGR